MDPTRLHQHPFCGSLGPCAGATDEMSMGFGTHPVSLPELRTFTQAFRLVLLCGPREAVCPVLRNLRLLDGRSCGSMPSPHLGILLMNSST